jgi:predicted nucleic acid-binding protein
MLDWSKTGQKRDWSLGSGRSFWEWLTVLVRRGKLTAEERQTGLSFLRALRLRIDHEAASMAFSRLSELASTYQLSVYDAAYLELAQRRELMLACKDSPLREAAKKSGVKLW